MLGYMIRGEEYEYIPVSGWKVHGDAARLTQGCRPSYGVSCRCAHALQGVRPLLKTCRHCAIVSYQLIVKPVKGLLTRCHSEHHSVGWLDPVLFGHLSAKARVSISLCIITFPSAS